MREPGLNPDFRLLLSILLLIRQQKAAEKEAQGAKQPKRFPTRWSYDA
jgi:hypothetical protein